MRSLLTITPATRRGTHRQRPLLAGDGNFRARLRRRCDLCDCAESWIVWDACDPRLLRSPLVADVDQVDSLLAHLEVRCVEIPAPRLFWPRSRLRCRRWRRARTRVLRNEGVWAPLIQRRPPSSHTRVAVADDTEELLAGFNHFLPPSSMAVQRGWHWRRSASGCSDAVTVSLPLEWAEIVVLRR